MIGWFIGVTLLVRLVALQWLAMKSGFSIDLVCLI